MIPLRSTIAGFGPHEKTKIDWANLTGPIAVTAPYGTGKTWTVEAVMAALFGTFAWYAGSIYDGLTQGGTGEGKIILEFEHKGEVYIAIRTITDTGKTRKQTAELFHKVNLIAGPKTSDFDRAINALVGDSETALATWFLSQNRKNDLCGQPGESDLVARRRGVFNSLIGANVLDKIEQRVAEMARESNTVARELEAQLAGEADPDELLKESIERLSYLQDETKTRRASLNELEQKLEGALERLRDAQGGDDVFRAQINEHEQNKNALSDAETRFKKLKAEIRELETRASGLQRARDEVERLESLSAERAALRYKQERYDAWQTYERRRTELDDEFQSWRRHVKTLQGIPGVDAETEALAASLDYFRREYKNATEANENARRWNQEYTSHRGNLEMQINSLLDRAAQIETRLSRKPETPFGADCLPCPLMQEWSKLPAVLSEIGAEIETLRARLKNVPENKAEVNLGDIQAKGAEAAAAQKTVEAAANTKRELMQAESREALAREALDVHENAHPQYRDIVSLENPRDTINAIQNTMDTLSGAPERIDDCLRAQSEAIEKITELKELESRVDSLEIQVKFGSEKAESARRAIENRERHREALVTETEALKQTVKSARADVEEVTSDIARLETRIHDLQGRAAERREKSERVEKLRADLDAAADIRQCFGPRGARQILIDAAAPDLEAIADDLFHRATGGRMRLRIATQTPLRDGSVQETFNILVRDERGERDALRYSGGQLQLIQILFRIAVAIWVGNLRGCQPDCLFLDEAFDRLGAEGTEDLLRVLEYLDDRIGLIVVVTHDTQIAARMRSQIRLEKRFGSIAVSTN